MNIFVILLMALFMAGYYFMDAPNTLGVGASKAEIAESAELRALLACVLRVHSDAVKADELAAAEQKTIFKTEIPCAEKYGIQTKKLCAAANASKAAASCVPDRPDKPVSNYIVTSTGAITDVGAGKALGIMARDYPHAANFGIVSADENGILHILSSGGASREINKSIVRDAAFEAGRLVYVTQYKIGGAKSRAAAAELKKIKCLPSESPIFRQGKWSCVPPSAAAVCNGDNIWDPNLSQCVPDASKRPLCKSNYTAVIVDDMWECVGAEQPKDCPENQIAEMDFEAMEWRCVPSKPDADESQEKKCNKVYDKIYGGGTTALRGNLAGCNDCERMFVHADCTAECVPDAAAIYNKACYDGPCRNFYFGFPDARYVAGAKKNLPQLNGVEAPLRAPYSKNRKFNCMECPYGIDEVASLPPYVIICRD